VPFALCISWPPNIAYHGSTWRERGGPLRAMEVSPDGGPVERPSRDGPAVCLLVLSAGLNVLLQLKALPFRVKKKTEDSNVNFHLPRQTFRLQNVERAQHFKRPEDWEEKNVIFRVQDSIDVAWKIVKCPHESEKS